MFCSKCGQSIADGSKFCPYCGAPAKTAPTPPAAPAEPVQQAPSQPQQAPSYNYVPPQQPNPEYNAYQQPQPAYPGNQNYSYPTQNNFAPVQNKNNSKWPLIVPILLLIGIIMDVVLIILNFEYIFKDWTTILMYVGTLFFAIISMIVFFAKTKQTPILSAVFHTLLFLIPVGMFVYSWVDTGSSYEWNTYTQYGSFLMMIILYFIGTGIGKRNVAMSMLYMLFGLAACVMLCWHIPDLIDYYDYFDTKSFISTLFDFIYLVPIILGFIIALFSLPKRNTI